MKKKKVLLSIMTIAVVAALVGVGVQAYFSDIEQSTGNVLTAGTLDLEVDTENPWASAAINITCWEPGNTTNDVLINVSSVDCCLDGDLYMNFTAVTDAGNIINEPECAAEGGTWYKSNSTCIGNTPVDNLSTKITLNVTWPNGSAVVGLDDLTLSAADDTWSTGHFDLVAGTFGNVVINATLASDTDNRYQGDNCTFTITFYLAQDGQSHPV